MKYDCTNLIKKWCKDHNKKWTPEFNAIFNLYLNTKVCDLSLEIMNKLQDSKKK